MTSSVLSHLVSDIAAGRIRVIDLAQTLTPDFPTIALPPEFGRSAPVLITPPLKIRRGSGSPLRVLALVAS